MKNSAKPLVIVGTLLAIGASGFVVYTTMQSDKAQEDVPLTIIKKTGPPTKMPGAPTTPPGNSPMKAHNPAADAKPKDSKPTDKTSDKPAENKPATP